MTSNRCWAHLYADGFHFQPRTCPKTRPARAATSPRRDPANSPGGIRMKQLARFLAVLAAAVAWLPAAAQQYPAKPVRVIVSTVPGPLDAFTRIVFEKVAAE